MSINSKNITTDTTGFNLTFHIVKNENIEHLERENDIWVFITDELVSSKQYPYSDNQHENYMNALCIIESMNGKLRFQYSGLNLLKLKDIADHKSDNGYSIPLQSLIQNTTLSLRFPIPNQLSVTHKIERIKFQSNSAQEVYSKCLQIFGFPNWDHWSNLNNIYELIIEYDSSLNFSGVYKTRFSYAANHRSSGLTARHQKDTNKLPPKEGSMSREEAVRHIRALLQKFLDKHAYHSSES